MSALTDQAYTVIDAMTEIAQETGSIPARVALAWVQNRPGVTSTIIGARTLAQLDDNLAALDLKLTPGQAARLEALTTPRLNFPSDFVKRAAAFSSSGTMINGVAAPVNPLAPRTEQDRF
jgi:diketogulonate reductase-like aldo/keto reductase